MDATLVTNLFGEYSAIAPMIIMIIGALVMPATYIWTKKKVPSTIILLAFILVSMLINGILLWGSYTGTYSGMFTYDAFSGLVILLFQTVVFLTALVSASSVETTDLHYGAYISLLLIAVTGMMFVAESNDLIPIFVGVETVSISSYVLVALKKNDPRAAEAAVKYVIVGSVSTAMTVYGISMLFGITGSTNIAAIAASLSTQGYTWAFIIAMVTMIAGYGFKIAAVPFHMWAPDVYEGAATPVSVLLATGSKKMGIVVFFKIFLVLFVAGVSTAAFATEEMQYTFAIIAALTMTVGNVTAIAQNNMKRMLAYSSIAQAGYILIAMAVMSQYAVTGGLFHMFTHVFMKGGAFLVVGALICAGVGEKISDYKGLAKRSPFLAAAMLLFLFSLAGIPPLAGFTSKFVLFSSTIYSPDGAITQWVWLAFIAILNSALSLYYYTRVVKTMYIEKPEAGASKIKVPKAFIAAILICVVFVILLGIMPGEILRLCDEASAALFC